MTAYHVFVRPAQPADAAAMAALANAQNILEGYAPDLYTEEVILAHAFGEKPLYYSWVGVCDGDVVAHIRFQDFYDAVNAKPGVWITDLMVAERARGHQLGRKLFDVAAHYAVAQGCVSMWWAVVDSNPDALGFYDHLQAKDAHARILEIDGRPLQAAARRGAALSAASEN
jgi:GNAT superfamily N-acetyltransferase